MGRLHRAAPPAGTAAAALQQLRGRTVRARARFTDRPPFCCMVVRPGAGIASDPLRARALQAPTPPHLLCAALRGVTVHPARSPRGSSLRHHQPCAAPFTTRFACGGSGSVALSGLSLHAPMLALGRLLPCLRGLCPLALPGSPDYPTPFPPPRARGGRGSAPPYPAPLGGFVGGRAGPPIFYGHPPGACLGSVVPGVPPSTALTP